MTLNLLCVFCLSETCCAASSSAPTWRRNQSLETCRAKWPASLSTTRTSTWTAGEASVLLKVAAILCLVFFYRLPPWRVSGEATLSWRTAQIWATWRTALPVVPTWCVWSDAASQWRPSTSAAAQGPTSDASVQTTGWESGDDSELDF